MIFRFRSSETKGHKKYDFTLHNTDIKVPCDLIQDAIKNDRTHITVVHGGTLSAARVLMAYLAQDTVKFNRVITEADPCQVIALMVCFGLEDGVERLLRHCVG